MKSVRTLMMAVMLLAVWSVSAMAASSLQAVAVDGTLTKKVDAYDYFVDYSGSMMMQHKLLKKSAIIKNIDKIEVVKQVLSDVNALIPALDYTAGLYRFAPYTAQLPHAPWNREGMEKSIDSIPIDRNIFDRMTDLGDGLLDQSKVIASEQGRKALIIASDGEANRGPNPVVEAHNLLQAYPELCFHIISVADTKEGQATLDAIAKLKKCSVSVKAEDLLNNPAAMQQFVNDVFYDSAMEEIIVLRGVNFAFNSSTLDGTAQGILNEVATNIQKNPAAKIQLNGYTDWIGSDAYNMGLSQRRADAVKRYLVARGVPAQRLMAIGKGKSFTYDNNTEEGRYMNRRVEVVFIEK